jgi:ribonuclease P protein component
LRSSDEIREVVSKGKRHSSKVATLHYLPSESNKYAIVVSKAVGGAVIRNQVKRRIRAALALHLDQKPSISGVFRARPGADAMAFEQIQGEIRELLGRIQ